MGLNSWAAFAGTPSDSQIAGDIAMKESEVNAALKTLRANGLEIVAIHHHMPGMQKQIIFLHFWGRGPAEKLPQDFAQHPTPAAIRSKSAIAQVFLFRAIPVSIR